MNIKELENKARELKELQRMDTNAIKCELPEMAQRYTKTATVRRLVIA